MPGSYPVAAVSRIEALVAAHRAAQTDHRSALAAEDRRALLAADRRAAAIVESLRDLGAAPIADGLVAESHSGDALIVALTCDGPGHDEVDIAMSNYRNQRDRVSAGVASV